MTAKRRGRVSFADDTFAGTTSLTSLPSVERAPTHAPLDQLALNPRNPRDTYENDAADELAASMAEIGQLQPATVVGRDVFLAHYPDDAEAIGDARWVVLMGNRRLTAARRAGIAELAITVQDRLGGADPQIVEATLVENIHREALPPLLEARELEALVERHGTAAAVARRVGKTEGWVSQRRRLLKLTPEMQGRLRAGDLTVEEAREVARRAATDQQDALTELRRGPAPTAGAPAMATPRRGRPRKALDVEAVAADLRRRLTDEQRAHLIELLGGRFTP